MITYLYTRKKLLQNKDFVFGEVKLFAVIGNVAHPVRRVDFSDRLCPIVEDAADVKWFGCSCVAGCPASHRFGRNSSTRASLPGDSAAPLAQNLKKHDLFTYYEYPTMMCTYLLTYF